MFLPIGDDNRDRQSIPIVNYLLILINILVFFFLQHWGQDAHFTMGYVTVPKEILTGQDIITPDYYVNNPYNGDQILQPGLQASPHPVFITLITSMFLHGGVAHLLGNMLYLWICGDNVEDALGHVNYLLFYLVCGVLAGLAHVFATQFLGQDTLTPCLGASGAISGVLAGYMLLFPRKRIHFWIFFIFTISLPAVLAVGLWFVFQVIDGLGVLGGDQAGGIAYAAHIGGFIAGLLLVKRFMSKERKAALVTQRSRFRERGY